MNINQDIVRQIVLPERDSKKGENGRVLVIGGSSLFHAAPFWAAATASKIVDMVHFSSPYLLNNELMERRAKEAFWNGIVVPWEEVEHYIQEDDCILIGPGMMRASAQVTSEKLLGTREIVNDLLSKYPEKKWVVDGGALQEVEPTLLTKTMIITPNTKEWERLSGRVESGQVAAMLLKGEVDEIRVEGEVFRIEGGSVGMTKGGTGDVLAGLVAGLYAKSEALPSCYLASLANKRAGERLHLERGVFFEANELLAVVGIELNEIMKSIQL
jgi:hydroxyethylthiazole kinase-like uncharacterized protein yjeF